MTLKKFVLNNNNQISNFLCLNQNQNVKKGKFFKEILKQNIISFIKERYPTKLSRVYDNHINFPLNRDRDIKKKMIDTTKKCLENLGTIKIILIIGLIRIMFYLSTKAY